MKRRDFNQHILTLGGLALTPWSALAQGGPIEGRHYVRLPQAIPPLVTGKIEVLEFFSYGCPHCYQFESSIGPWEKKLAADVSFKRIPVPFLANVANFQKIYFTLEAMGLVESLQAKVFYAVHQERQRLDSLESILAWATRQGVDAVKFADQFKSFSVNTKVAQARKVAQAYGIDSVPMMAVNGRFITDIGRAGGPAQALQVVDFLVAQSRTKP